jgi:hypothetical protein
LQIPKKKFRVKELIPYHKFSFGVLSLLPFAAATFHDAIQGRQQDEEGFHFGCIYCKQYKKRSALITRPGISCWLPHKKNKYL